jgi:hypothetical protein
VKPSDDNVTKRADSCLQFSESQLSFGLCSGSDQSSHFGPTNPDTSAKQKHVRAYRHLLHAIGIYVDFT